MNDGGPAFPVPSGCGLEKGMSLRDWLAGQALNGLLSMTSYTDCSHISTKDAAANAYEMADALIAQREKEI